MPRKPLLSRNQLIGCLREVFLDHGYEGASLSVLAQSAGLGKATLYHHFPKGKTDMAEAVLAFEGARLQKYVIQPLKGSKDPKEKIVLSLEGIRKFYYGDVPGCSMNSMLMGSGRQLFSSGVSAVLKVWTSSLQAVLNEVPENKYTADEIIERVQGALVRCRSVGNREPLENCLSLLKQEFSAE